MFDFLRKLLFVGIMLNSYVNATQIYIDIHLSGNFNFTRQIKNVTPEDIANLVNFDLPELQQELRALVSQNTKNSSSQADEDASQISNKTITSMIALDPMDSLRASIEAIEKTLEFVSNPGQPDGIEALPELNKEILLDLSAVFIEEGKLNFEPLLCLLKQSTHSNEQLFDTSSQIINWGFQTDQDYEKYTEEGHLEYLQSLINCFIYCKGLEIQGLNPTISIDSLEVLTRSAIEHSGYIGHSEQILNLFRLFVKNAKF